MGWCWVVCGLHCLDHIERPGSCPGIMMTAVCELPLADRCVSSCSSAQFTPSFRARSHTFGSALEHVATTWGAATMRSAISWHHIARVSGVRLTATVAPPPFMLPSSSCSVFIIVSPSRSHCMSLVLGLPLSCHRCGSRLRFMLHS